MGLTVLDLSHKAAGPFCTMLLGDFGARIALAGLPPPKDRTGDPGLANY